jgi:hypothetical protein
MEEDIFDMESQSDVGKDVDGPKIATKILNDNHIDLDKNEGNIAFIIKNFQSEKKPKSDRNIINWGSSQSQRGKTTFYPCNGYFRCDKCQIKAKFKATCTNCEIPLTHRKCGAKKYVYFCNDTCVREVFKTCCDIKPTLRKLVLLYVGKHSCISMNLIDGGMENSKFKQVKTKEDVLNNIKTLVEKESECFSIENVDKVPSGIDGNKYFVIENTKNQDMKEIIRDGRKWQTYTQTSSQAFANVLGDINSKKIRKYKCSNQYFCFNQECPFKKRFELVNQVYFLYYWSALAPTPAQLQLGAKEAINWSERSGCASGWRCTRWWRT